MDVATFTITGMSCGHCEASVREEVGRLDGVRSLEVSAAVGTLRIATDTAIADADVIAAVGEAGYAAVRTT